MCDRLDPRRVHRRATDAGACCRSANYFASSTQQYTLSGNNGSTWAPLDTTQLSLTIAATQNETAVITGNAALFANSSGSNEDLAITVAQGSGGAAVAAWTESPSATGFNPNAAGVQASWSLAAGMTYTVRLAWKASASMPSGQTFYDGAGGPTTHSPTTLSATVTPSGDMDPVAVRSTSQYGLPSSDGSTWETVDGTALTTTVSPSVAVTAQLSANASLFTNTGAVNQDLAIFVTPSGQGSTLVAWKESGGSAVYAPDGVLVTGSYAMQAGPSYVVTLKWKTNVPTSGSVFAGAGTGSPYSPTSLIVLETASTDTPPTQAASTTQYSLSNSDGSTWTDIDSSTLAQTITPTTDVLAVITGTMDLFAFGNINQDVAVTVVQGSTTTVAGWTESGGQQSDDPIASYVQSTFLMTHGVTYTVKLQWKSNVAMQSGQVMYDGAGTNPYSPTTLSVQQLQPYPIAASLGELKGQKLDPHQLWDRADLQVNVASGNLILHESDLRIAGTGHNLVIDRYYNSRETDSGGDFGTHWSMSTGKDVYLSFGMNQVTFVGPSGFHVTYTTTDCVNYSQPSAIDATLTHSGASPCPTGSAWTVSFHQTQENTASTRKASSCLTSTATATRSRSPTTGTGHCIRSRTRRDGRSPCSTRAGASAV